MNEYVDAILFNVMPGQKYANGLMNVIFGHANPSAKLTFTIPKDHSEQGWTKEHYDDDEKQSVYSEKHHFGYRWYDQYDVEPAYAFGHGLSYT